TLYLQFSIYYIIFILFFFFFSSRRRHTRWPRDWSSDVCSSDLAWRLRPSKLPSGVHLSTFLFDLDGTLIDSIELILRSYRHTMRLHRGQEPSDDVWMQGLGTPLWVQFRQFTDDPAEIEAMVTTYRAYNLAHHDEMVRPYDGVVEAVRALRDRGKTLGLVTSKMR